MTEVPVSVHIDPAQINQHIANAVLDSALGKQVKEAIEQALSSRFTGRSIVDEAVRQAVHEQVRFLARELVQGEFRGVIAERIRAALDEEALDQLTERFVDSLGLIHREDMAS